VTVTGNTLQFTFNDVTSTQSLGELGLSAGTGIQEQMSCKDAVTGAALDHDKCKCECEPGKKLKFDGAAMVCGDPHHKTFDGVTIDFEGPCTYVWSSYHGNKYQPFDIVARYEIHWTSNWKVSELTTYFKGNKVTLSRKRISANGEVIYKLPYSDPTGSFKIKQEGPFVVFESSNGIRVGYNRRWIGYVKVPDEYNGLVGGILGDADGDPNNDLQTKDGVTVGNNKYGHCLIGSSWQFDSKERCSYPCQKPAVSAP
jgi:hypothetical protein